MVHEDMDKISMICFLAIFLQIMTKDKMLYGKLVFQ